METMNEVSMRTYSIRVPRYKTITLLKSHNGLHKKRKYVKTITLECFDFLRKYNKTSITIKGGRKNCDLYGYKYHSGMDLYVGPRKLKRVFNTIPETQIDEDTLDSYHEDMMTHFPQDKKMLEKEMKLKTLRFAEGVCGLMFNNEKMFNNSRL